MFIIDRIRAHGGEVIRDKWNFRLRPGDLTPEAVAWVRANKDALARELWPEFDEWKSQADAIEASGVPRPDAEAEAYRRVSQC